MPTRTMMRRGLAALALSAAVLLPACGGSTSWRKEGATQVDYDRDAQECAIIAEPLARDKSLLGLRYDPADYANAFQSCLLARGWTVLASESVQSAPEAPMVELVTMEGRTMSAFGKDITLPDGFSLAGNNLAKLGPAVMQTLTWENADGIIAIFNFQKNQLTDFDITPYPLLEGTFVYEDVTEEGDGKALRGSLFAGTFRDGWIAGYGAFWRPAPMERVILTIIRDIPAPQSEIPPGLRIAENQKVVIERLRERWRPWIRHNFADERGFNPLDYNLIKGI